jgi:hypothetical protein
MTNQVTATMAVAASESDPQPNPESSRSRGLRDVIDTVLTASAMFAPPVSRRRSLWRLRVAKLVSTLGLPDKTRKG